MNMPVRELVAVWVFLGVTGSSPTPTCPQGRYQFLSKSPLLQNTSPVRLLRRSRRCVGHG